MRVQRQPLPDAADREAAAPRLLVADDVEAPSGSQLRKTDFLAELRAEVCAAAEPELEGTEWSTDGCPWLDHWFAYYEARDAAHLERALRRYAPEAQAVYQHGMGQWSEATSTLPGNYQTARITTDNVASNSSGLTVVDYKHLRRACRFSGHQEDQLENYAELIRQGVTHEGRPFTHRNGRTQPIPSSQRGHRKLVCGPTAGGTAGGIGRLLPGGDGTIVVSRCR